MTLIALTACLSLACILTALVVSYAAAYETGTSVSFALLLCHRLSMRCQIAAGSARNIPTEH